MDKHASGALPGKIPQGWLSLNQYSVCSSCSILVAISHTHAHISHCSGSNSCVTDINHAVDTNDPGVTMDHEYPLYFPHHFQLAEEGLFSKACHMLTSSGIAANNEETWELLKTNVPIPSPPINIPPQSSVDLLPSDFIISAVLLSFPKDTSCGPSGLRVQHLLDASEASLPSSLLSALKAVINKLASRRALPERAEYLAGATVIALKKPVGNDIRPISVGEVLRRLTSKCLCAIVKSKASEFFNPYQYGVVCPSGVDKIIHSLRSSIDDHWFDEDFNVAKKMHLTWCLEMLC